MKRKIVFLFALIFLLIQFPVLAEDAIDVEVPEQVEESDSHSSNGLHTTEGKTEDENLKKSVETEEIDGTEQFDIYDSILDQISDLDEKPEPTEQGNNEELSTETDNKETESEDKVEEKKKEEGESKDNIEESSEDEILDKIHEDLEEKDEILGEPVDEEKVKTEPEFATEEEVDEILETISTELGEKEEEIEKTSYKSRTSNSEEKDEEDSKEEKIEPEESSKDLQMSLQNIEDSKEEKPKDLFKWLKKQIEKIKNEENEEDRKGEIDLYSDEYLFTETITINNKADISLYNPNGDGDENAAIFKRADGFDGSFFTISDGKLTIGEQRSSHQFSEEKITIGNTSFKKKNKINNGEFINNNIIFDGGNRNFVTDSSKKGSALTIKDEVVINGAEFKNFVNYHPDKKREYSLIYLEGNENKWAKLIINDIDIHENTFLTCLYDSNYEWQGGLDASIIHLSSYSEAEMNGGTIKNNMISTGTVQVSSFASSNVGVSSRFVLNDGEISYNDVTSKEVNDFNGSAGVTVYSNGEFIMYGGEISHNVSHDGGGVHVNPSLFQLETIEDGSIVIKTSKESFKEKSENETGIFVMNGGTISNNHAKSYYTDKELDALYENISDENLRNLTYGGTGGGIYVNSNDVIINAGKILDNKADNMGGGIYVSHVPIQFELKNAVITGNHAISDGKYDYGFEQGNGGGYWNCPTGSFYFNVEEGNLIFDNTADSRGQDIFATGKIQKVLWEGEDITKHFVSKLIPIDRYGLPIDYESENEFELLTSTEEIAFILRPNKKSILAAKNLPILIKGNVAKKGGGVGSNANVDFGIKENYEIEVKKIWDLVDNNPPDDTEIEVELYFDDMIVDRILIDSTKTYKFKNLPYNPVEFFDNYTVKEILLGEFDDVKPNIIKKKVKSENDNILISFEIVNQTIDKKTGDIIISKVVIGEENSDKEFNFTIVLRDGEKNELDEIFNYIKSNAAEIIKKGEIKSGDTFTLKNGEKIRIQEVPYGTEYKVTEEDTGEYIISSVNSEGVVESEETFVEFTNTKPDEPDEPNNPPETPEEPDEPEEPPTPPEEPEEPSEPEKEPIEPSEPEEPPVEPYNPYEAPKTFDEGIAIYLLIALFSVLGFAVLRKEYN